MPYCALFLKKGYVRYLRLCASRITQKQAIEMKTIHVNKWFLPYLVGIDVYHLVPDNSSI